MPKYGTYQQVHDELVRKYRRYALYGVWTGFLSLISLIIFATNYLQGKDALALGAVYNVAVIVGLSITQAIKGPRYLFVIIAGIITLLLGGLFSYLGYKAYKGSRRCLILTIVIYGIDALIFSFTPLISFYDFLLMDYLLTIFVHIAIIAILIYALIKRQEIVNLVKKKKAKVVVKEEKGKKVILSYRKDKDSTEKVDFADDGIVLDSDKSADKEQK